MIALEKIWHNDGVGIKVTTSYGELIIQRPIGIHFSGSDALDNWKYYGYNSLDVVITEDDCEAKDTIATKGAIESEWICVALITTSVASFKITDRYLITNNAITLTRSVTVIEAFKSGVGFVTKFCFELPYSFEDAYFMAPGLWYQKNEYTPYYSIGSKKLLSKYPIQNIYFREDRVAAPMITAFKDSNSMCCMLSHLNPIGTTIKADDSVMPLIDKRLAFGSLGVERKECCHLGFMYPGSEGEVSVPPWDWSYAIITVDDLENAIQQQDNFEPSSSNPRMNWMLRFHPIENGFTQNYSLCIDLWISPDFPDCLRQGWRKSWERVSPKVVKAPLKEIYKESICHLYDLLQEKDGAIGIPWVTGVKHAHVIEPEFALGFVGRCTETAYYLIHAGYHFGNAEYLEKGRRMMSFWAEKSGLGLSQSVYNYSTNKWTNYGLGKDTSSVFLRPVVEGHLACLEAWKIERDHRKTQNTWIKWVVSFGDWLVEHQNNDGSFYRMYNIDGNAGWEVKEGTHVVVKFLLRLSKLTGEPKYAKSAEKAAVFSLASYHSRGFYVGGTIDNPNCYDKEGGALALEAYLSMYEFTNNDNWLDAAKKAADYTETWIYLWDIPLPEDDKNSRQWSPNVGTTGLQLVCTGHSLCDLYLAFNCGEFAKLALYTGDPHYFDVAQILLFNTKFAFPMTTELKLAYPAFQQEHWTFSAGRGYDRDVIAENWLPSDDTIWLPWVTISHLEGMRNMGLYSDFYI